MTFRAERPAAARARRSWLELNDVERAYHLRQFEEPYRSTVAFAGWLAELGCLGHGRILDVGAGAGANLDYLARQFPTSSFVGIDLNPELVAIGQERGLALREGDLYNLAGVGGVDGVVSFQVLSWMPEIEAPLRAMAALGPRWIAASSLFSEADISTSTRVLEHETRKESSYNVYSLPRVAALLTELGYPDFRYRRFDIDVDLDRPAGMGTYTERLEDGRRLQISGPVLMPWYFMYAARGQS